MLKLWISNISVEMFLHIISNIINKISLSVYNYCFNVMWVVFIVDHANCKEEQSKPVENDAVNKISEATTEEARQSISAVGRKQLETTKKKIKHPEICEEDDHKKPLRSTDVLLTNTVDETDIPLADTTGACDAVRDSSALELHPTDITLDLQAVLSTTSQFSAAYSPGFQRSTRRVEGQHASRTTFDKEFRIKTGAV